MAAEYIRTTALFGRFFKRRVVTKIEDCRRYPRFYLRTPDPKYRGPDTRGEMQFVIISTPAETHFQILRDNTHLVLSDSDGKREHLIFNGNPDFVVRHTSSSNGMKRIR